MSAMLEVWNNYPDGTKFAAFALPDAIDEYETILMSFAMRETALQLLEKVGVIGEVVQIVHITDPARDQEPKIMSEARIATT